MPRRDIMEAKEYYGALQSELTEWKGKAHDVVGKFEEIPTETKNRLRPFLDEIRSVIEEHTARMEALGGAFPAKWRSERAQKRRPSILRRIADEVTKYHAWHIRHL